MKREVKMGILSESEITLYKFIKVNEKVTIKKIQEETKEI